MGLVVFICMYICVYYVPYEFIENLPGLLTDMKYVIIFKEDKEIVELPGSDISLDPCYREYTLYISDWARLDQLRKVPCRAYYNDDVFRVTVPK